CMTFSLLAGWEGVHDSGGRKTVASRWR
ncbi:MAG: hypothetical protein JWL58_885, partial [Streptosporangiaceae bacterium]|nr:hypothetical protein [Streptosporangiaceae bacterium]